jgi:hypothetical protein
LTGAPLCRPTPRHSTADRIVCSNGKLAPEYLLEDEQITPAVANDGCGKITTMRGKKASSHRVIWSSGDRVFSPILELTDWPIVELKTGPDWARGDCEFVNATIRKFGYPPMTR